MNKTAIKKAIATTGDTCLPAYVREYILSNVEICIDDLKGWDISFLRKKGASDFTGVWGLDALDQHPVIGIDINIETDYLPRVFLHECGHIWLWHRGKKSLEGISWLLADLWLRRGRLLKGFPPPAGLKAIL